IRRTPVAAILRKIRQNAATSEFAEPTSRRFFGRFARTPPPANSLRVTTAGDSSEESSERRPTNSPVPAERAPARPTGPRQWTHGRPTRDRLDPRRTGVVPIPRRRRPRDLRRQGQEPPVPALELLPAARAPARAHPSDGGDRRIRRVDRRQERGRGLLPRVQP